MGLRNRTKGLGIPEPTPTLEELLRAMPSIGQQTVADRVNNAVQPVNPTATPTPQTIFEQVQSIGQTAKEKAARIKPKKISADDLTSGKSAAVTPGGVSPAQTKAPDRTPATSTRQAIEALLAQPQQFNLQGVAALVDAQTGSKFTEAFRQRETPELRRQRDLQALIKLEDLDAKKEIAAVKAAASLATKGRLTESSILTNRIKLENFAEKRSTKVLDSLNDNISKLNTIKQTLASREIGQIKPVLGQIASFISLESGRKTEDDIGRTLFQTLNTITQTLIARISSNPAIQFEAKDLEPLFTLLDRSEISLLDVADAKINIGLKNMNARETVKTLGSSVAAPFINAKQRIDDLRAIQIKQTQEIRTQFSRPGVQTREEKIRILRERGRLE